MDRIGMRRRGYALSGDNSYITKVDGWKEISCFSPSSFLPVRGKREEGKG